MSLEETPIRNRSQQVHRHVLRPMRGNRQIERFGQKRLAIRERLAAADRSNTQWRHDLQYSIGRVGGLAYRFVLARDFARALEVVDQAISLAPNKVWLYRNGRSKRLERSALTFLTEAHGR